MKITLTGLGGTGKSTVARLVAEQMGYSNMSGGNIFRTMAVENNMTIEEFDQFVKGGDESFDRKLDERQKKYGQENDNFIFESRLGWYFIPDSVKFKLVCELDERIRRISKDTGEDRIAHTQSDFEETKTKTLAREESYSRYGDLYGIETWDDDKNFDYIIDTTNIGPKEVADSIVQIIKSL